MSFTSLGVSPALVQVLDTQGISSPTPIQSGAIPPSLQQNDVLGIAKTGSGKTASYVLPILQNLEKATEPAAYREPTVLVLVPTRELAQQVHSVFETFLPALTDRYLSLIHI